MKIILLLVTLLALAGCNPDMKSTGNVNLKTYHDDQRAVTCWIFDGVKAGGIHCMTDEQIAKKVGP